MPFKLAVKLARRVYLVNEVRWINEKILEEEERDKNHDRYMRSLLAEKYTLEGELRRITRKGMPQTVLAGWPRERQAQCKERDAGGGTSTVQLPASTGKAQAQEGLVRK